MRTPPVSIWISCGVLLCGAVWVTGCSSSFEDRRYPVEGKVVVGGEPVPTGEVRFVPIEHAPSLAAEPTLTGIIEAGAYRVETFGGLLVGAYRVEVDARRKTGKQTMVSMGTETVLGDETVLIAPDEFTGPTSTLRLEVGRGFTGVFDIDLPIRSE